MVGGAVLLGIASWYFSGYKDNPLEQAMEKVIEKEIGVSVDLSPEE